MKKLLPLFSFILLFMYSCNEQVSKKKENLLVHNENPLLATDVDMAAQFLQRFYSNYIYLQAQDVPDRREINKTLHLWCTPELIARLEKIELEADPFLNTQDVDARWAATLRTEKKTTLEYVVSFIPDESGKRIAVPVTLTETANGFQIVSVNGY